MRVKRFRGKTIGDAVNLMKKEFGRDAVILNTKRLKRGGLFGLFGKPYFEIIGAIDQDTSELNPYMKKKIEPKVVPPAIKQVAHHSQSWSTPVQGLYDQLVALNIEHNIALELMKSALNKSPKQYWNDPLYLKEQIRADVSSRITTEQCWDLSNERKIVALVGPTGVGKTTTIAKLAAKYQLFTNSNVGLITLDTYRMAAVEQLRTYAEIIGIPLTVAYNQADLNGAIADMADKNLVLVDTAGHSHFNQAQMTELKLLLSTINAETHLAINACTKNEDLACIISAYGEIGIDRLIITKLDETRGYGILIQAPYLAKVPIAFVTTGQSVPDDIEVAGANNLTKLVLGD